MPLSDYDIEQLTSVYGIGRAEAQELGALLNAVEADTASEVSVLAQHALKQLVSAGAIGAAERRDVLAALVALINDWPAVERDADVINFFTRRLIGLDRVEMAAILEAAYTQPVVASVYLLDDDGTVAALFGRASAPATAPDYHTVDYTYVAPATGNAAVAISSDPWGDGAIVIDGVMAVELIINSVPVGDFGNVGLSAVASSEGTPNLSHIVNVMLSRQSDVATVVGEQGLEQTVVGSLTGFRIGVEFDGATGLVTIRTTEGLLGTTELAEFTAGEAMTFTISITDNNASTAETEVSVTLVTQAADMTLSYTAGATDIYGVEI